jgi:hypothetical protein
MFNFEEIKESNTSDVKYIKHGAHIIKVKDIEVLTLDGANYKGEVADVTFEDKDGAINNWRVFPFKYSDQVNEYKSGQIVGTKSEADQIKDYLTKIKHIFNKPLGEEVFKKATTGIKDFKHLFTNLKAACKKYNNEFAMMFISDNKGYAKVPKWSAGFASSVENLDQLKELYNSKIAKYGPQSAPTNSEKPATTSANLNDLFSQINSPVTGMAAATEEDDLPF